MNRKDRRRHLALQRQNSSKRASHAKTGLVNTAVAGVVGLGLAGVPAAAQVTQNSSQCSSDGTTITCSGDLSTGVAINGQTENALVINNVNTGGIAPPLGSGISMSSNDGKDTTITVDTGTAGTANNGITVNGANGSSGILAQRNRFSNGAVSITSRGNISLQGLSARGIKSDRSNSTGATTISSTGNITSSAQSVRGIYADHNGSSGSGDTFITSTGNITLSGPSSMGIYGKNNYSSGNMTLKSYGDITVNGGASRGLVVSNYDSKAGDVSITSVGNIEATGVSSYGIWSRVSGFKGNSSNTTITSTGNITTQRIGISARLSGAQSGNITITSTGNITTSNQYGSAIFVENSSTSGNITITSNGQLSAPGSSSFGIYANPYMSSGAISITTSGSISANTGIFVNRNNKGLPVTITNSGAITGTGGMAIVLGGSGNDVINLNAGSVITGAIDFGNGNDGKGGTNKDDIDTLNIGPGVNAVITFADSGFLGQVDSDLQSAPEIINVSGGTFALNGAGTSLTVNTGGATQVVTVDSTGFTAPSVAVSNVNDTVQNIIESSVNTVSGRVVGTVSGGSGVNRLSEFSDFGGVSRGSNGLGFGDPSASKGFFDRVWVVSFGGRSESDRSSATNAIASNFYGVVTGFESDQLSTGTLGVFAGASTSRTNTDGNATLNESDSLFGGLYYKLSQGDNTLSATLSLGTLDQKNTRNIVGQATPAVAGIDGRFYSGALTYTTPLGLSAVPAFLSGRVSYSHIGIDGYTETGGGSPLTVSGRNIGIFGARAQINLPSSKVQANGNRRDFDFNFGLDGEFTRSDDIVVLSSGTTSSFAARSNNGVSGFAKAGLSFVSEDGLRVFGASAEVKSDFSDGDYLAIGQLTASFRF